MVCNPFTEDTTNPLIHFKNFTALVSLWSYDSDSRNSVNKKEASNQLIIMVT